jgi:hypothetical protein
MAFVEAASALIALSNASGPSTTAPTIFARTAIAMSEAESIVAAILDSPSRRQRPHPSRRRA